MNVIEIKDKSVHIAVDEEEARHILDGLARHAQDLGEEAEALRAALQGAGVEPPAPPEHVRHEYEGDPTDTHGDKARLQR